MKTYTRNVLVTGFVAMACTFGVVDQTSAQGMVLLGDNSFARRCFQAADRAALTQMANDDDIEQCTSALDLGGLKPSDRVATLVNRGVLFSAQENYTAAKKDYLRALKIRGHGGEVYANIGNLDFLLRDYDQALVNYAKAIEMGMPRVHVAHVNRGMVFENLDQLDMAKMEYQTAIEIAPEWKKATELLLRVEKKQAKLKSLKSQ